jgi:hypothetical protein
VAARPQALDREISPIQTLSDRRLIAPAAALFVLAGVALGASLGTWTDEEYSLATSAHGIAYAIDHAIRYELQAPLYFALLAAWRSPDAAVWYARLFSVLCGAGTLVALASIGRRIAPRGPALGFALWAGLNPYAVWAALEIRHYGLALFLSALLWLAFDAGFFSGDRRDARFAFVALAIAGIYTQYFIGFALAGFGVALLVIGKPRAFAVYLACTALVVAAAVPLALQARGEGNWFATEAPSLGQILRRTLIHPWLGFVFPYDWQWDAYRFVRRGYTVAACLALLAGALCRPRLARTTLALVAAASAIELIYVLMAAALRIELSDRYFIALYVPVAAAAYALWNDVARERPLAGRTLFAFSAALAAATLVSQYRHLAQPGDWKRVAAYLQERARVPDAISVYQPDALPAFARQYHGDVTVVPYPRPLSRERYTVAAVSVRSDSEARRAFAALRARPRIWFVEDGRCDVRAPQFGCEYVERAIAVEFTVRSSRQFYGSRVDELVPLRARTAAERTGQPKPQRGRNVVVPRHEHRG